MRVLMIMGNLLAGGAEMAALELARGLARGGRSVTVAALRGDGVLADAFSAAGARVYRRLARWRFDLLAALRLAGIIRRHEIDCVIVVNALRNGLFYAPLAVALSGRSVVRICWCHAVHGRQAGRFALRLRAYLALGVLDAVVCVSRYQRRGLAEQGVDRRRMPLIRNGVDLDRFENASETDLPLPGDKRTIVTVANQMPDKDYATLLAAAALLARSRDDVHFVFVGRDTDSPAMARAASRVGLDGAVTLAGHREDIPGILAAAEVFVLSTRSESFGLAVAEAMAAGLPVVASDVPALAELFAHGCEGLKVPPGQAQALADAIEQVLADDSLRAELSAAGRRRARRFNHSRMTENFLRLIRRGVAQKSNRDG